MNKFRRLKITLTTVLCLISGNKVSNLAVNAETPKSTKVSENSKRKDIEVTKEEEEVITRLLVSLVIFVIAVYFRDPLGLAEKDDYPHGETYCKVIKGIPVYSNGTFG